VARRIREEGVPEASIGWVMAVAVPESVRPAAVGHDFDLTSRGHPQSVGQARIRDVLVLQ
jgi:hypothetical protein